MNMKRWISWITGVAIVGGVIWTFFYLKDMNPLGPLGSKLERKSSEEVAISFTDSKLIGWSNGKKAWAFQAGAIEVSKNRRFATLTGLKKGSLVKDDKPIASLSAKKVIYDIFTRDLTVPGGAEFKLKDGPSFKVRDASWDARESRLTCEKGVDAELAGSTLHGKRLIADLSKKELTIEKVSGVMKIEELEKL